MLYNQSIPLKCGANLENFTKTYALERKDNGSKEAI